MVQTHSIADDVLGKPDFIRPVSLIRNQCEDTGLRVFQRKSVLRYKLALGVSNRKATTMSLKDETEKLLDTEQPKLEGRDKKNAEYQQRRRQRFASLSAVLDEIFTSVDPKYLGSYIHNDSARIELGTIEKSHRSIDVMWNVEPNDSVRFGAAADEGLFREEPGFRVEETICYRNLPEGGPEKNTRIYEDEQAVSEYLTTEIAKWIARYGHSESQAAKK
jgi:hypothetical protein